MNKQKNVDDSEITKFNRHAHQWWDENGELKTLHRINPVRMQFILDHVDLSHKKVLDIGCGGGILTESLAKAGSITTGIDMAAELIEIAKIHAGSQALDINYQCISAEKHAADHSAYYDVITCMELLEHVPSPADIVQACARLLKPGGHLFLSTINRTAKAYLFAIIGAEYILKLLPRQTHDYSKFIKPAELADWARDNDLTVNHITGLSYQPFTNRVAISEDVQVNYLMHCLK